MIQLGHVERIVGEACHQLSCFLLVVKAKGQLLVMIEQLAAHVTFHEGAHHMSLVVNKHVAKRMDEEQPKHHSTHAINLT